MPNTAPTFTVTDPETGQKETVGGVDLNAPTQQQQAIRQGAASRSGSGAQAQAQQAAANQRQAAESGRNAPDMRRVLVAPPNLRRLVDAYGVWRLNIINRRIQIQEPYRIQLDAIVQAQAKVRDKLYNTSGVEKFFGSFTSIVSDVIKGFATSGASIAGSVLGRVSGVLGENASLQQMLDQLTAEQTRVQDESRAATARQLGPDYAADSGRPANLLEVPPLGARVEYHAPGGRLQYHIDGTANHPDYLRFLQLIEVI